MLVEILGDSIITADPSIVSLDGKQEHVTEKVGLLMLLDIRQVVEMLVDVITTTLVLALETVTPMVAITISLEHIMDVLVLHPIKL